MLTTENALLVAAAFLVGGLVKGTIGLGLPVVVLTALVFVMPLRDAMAVFLVPGIASNVWQATNGPWLGLLARRLWSFLAAAVFGIAVGVTVMAGSRSNAMVVVLGGLLIAYSSYALVAPRLPQPGRGERWLSPLAGASGGVLFGMTGLFIVPSLLYLETLRLPRDQFVQALGLTFVTISTTLALAMAGHALLGADHLILSAIGLPPVFAGLWAGRRLRHRISEAGFRKAFFVALIVTGVYMIVRSLGGGPV